ncbi:MAG: tyrosine-type recombinase/integrase [Candidatus Nanopelagicales bacterium]
MADPKRRATVTSHPRSILPGSPTTWRPGSVLLERLAEVVRPQFLVEPLVFTADDPVFGGGACAVAGCPRSARARGMCQGHHLRWAKAGRPEIGAFAAVTDPRWKRQQPNASCRVSDCGYGAAAGGMCQLHRQRWARAKRPDLDAWLADPLPITAPQSPACRVAHCRLWPQASGPFCHAHAATWRANGRPDPADFIARFAPAQTTEDEIIRLDRLGPQLRLEVAYGLQCRNDERASKTPPAVVMRVVRFLATSDAVSLLDLTEISWRDQIGLVAGTDRSQGTLLAYLRRQVDDLADAGGWEAEYPRDVWQMRRLGCQGNQTLDLTKIPQPWLRALTKRWLRWRLGTGLNLETVRRGLRALTRFAGFAQHIGVTSLAGVDRGVLERWLADLHAQMGGAQRHGDTIGQLSSFLQAIRQHRWDDTLPANALLFTDDYPTRVERPPRALAEQVMAQIEHPDNLAKWPNPAYRLVTLILIRAGLRVSDALTLTRDAVTHDAQGAPYLRYYNHKMKREALVPIDEELHALITDQQAAVAKDHPAADVLFPRPTKNPDGRAPIRAATYRGALYRWLLHIDIRDEHARPVQLTPHQWRHTLGTRLINRDVPQEVVRRILDHDSPQMTAHYARLHDTTVRRHWEAARKVDITGQQIVIDPDGPLAEASWANQRLGRATQALPNGFCGLPVQQTCPHANACLTCPMFATTTGFLPEHRNHREQVLQIITAAQARGQDRLVEMNQQVLTNLDRIITSLEDEPRPEDIADAG